MTAPTWLTAAEVAALLRISKMTVYRMVDDGELPAIRFGGNERRTVRIPVAALTEFVAASWVGGIPDGYRISDLLGETGGEPSDGDVVQLPAERRADR